MPIEFDCSCGRAVRVKPELAGKKIRCPGCGNPVLVPAEGSSAPPAKRGSGKNPAPGKQTAVKPTAPSQVGKEVRQPKRKTEFDVVPMAESGKSGGSKTFPCPGCGAKLYAGDIMCISCGMDLSTGQWILPEKQESMGSSTTKLVVGLVGAVVLVSVGGYFVFKGSGAKTGKPGNTPVATNQEAGTETPPANTEGGTPEVPAVAGADEEVQQALTADGATLAAVAPLITKHQAALLPALAATVLKFNLAGEARVLALKTMALYARRGYADDAAVASLSTALSDADPRIQAAAHEVLYLFAFPQGSTTFDEELKPLVEGLPAAAAQPAPPAAMQALISLTSDPNNPLYCSAIEKLAAAGQPPHVGKAVELLANQGLPQPLREKCLAMLTRVSGRSFAKAEEWKAWWETASSTSSGQWLVDALLAPDTADRKAVHLRLTEISGHSEVPAPEGNDAAAWKSTAEAWKPLVGAN